MKILHKRPAWNTVLLKLNFVSQVYDFNFFKTGKEKHLKGTQLNLTALDVFASSIEITYEMGCGVSGDWLLYCKMFGKKCLLCRMLDKYRCRAIHARRSGLKCIPIWHGTDEGFDSNAIRSPESTLHPHRYDCGGSQSLQLRQQLFFPLKGILEITFLINRHPQIQFWLDAVHVWKRICASVFPAQRKMYQQIYFCLEINFKKVTSIPNVWRSRSQGGQVFVVLSLSLSLSVKLS